MEQIQPLAGSVNGAPGQRKNFLIPEMEADQVLKKREEFAINLRKKKTKDMIKQKRRKIAQSMANSQRNEINGGFPVNT